MIKIASTGVKGGVGKSTFAILYSWKLTNEGKKVVLCDCDVECPNDFLILNQDLKDSKPIYNNYPVLDKEKCKKCGLCSKTCKENAIFWVEGQYPKFIEDMCIGCGACWLACPTKAIKTEKKLEGEIFVNKITDNFWLVTGKCRAGVSETGPVVHQVKKEALKLAKEKDIDYFIIDTAPGTHCSVIQALLNMDKIYAVTEPTPLGSHDLGLILELVRVIGNKVEIVINKSDVGKKDDILKLADKYKTKVSFEIPYSEDLVKAYCEKDLKRVVNLI